MVLNDRFYQLQTSVLPAMYIELSKELGVSAQTLTELGLGYDYKYQAWVFAERDEAAKVVGLSYRYESGKKTMAPGIKNKRGLVYPVNKQYGKGIKRYVPGKHNFVRTFYAGVLCPVCGKPDGCLVSADCPDDPAAAICIRPDGKKGAKACLGDSGYLHILKPEGNARLSMVLPESDMPVLVVEGASDVLAAMSLGYVAIGRPSAKAGMEILSKMPLSGREVWIIGENDAGAGREGMEKAYSVISRMTPKVKCAMPPDGIKDLRSWLSAGVTQEEFSAYVDETEEQITTDSGGVFSDGQPTTIARAFIKDNFNTGDATTLKNWRGEWYEWKDGCHVRLDNGHVRGRIYSYTENKSYVKETNNGGKIVIPVPTTRHMIGDILDCLNMPDLCPVSVDPPTWLKDVGLPDPKNLIAFKNGLLDVGEYIRGNIRVYNPNPNLFILNMFPYSFDEDAESKLCEDFFEEIFGEKDAIRLLQQWFGYNTVPDMSQEKMMLFTGRPRSGKSTTLDMLRGMLGQDQCCSLQMSHLVSRFGRHPMLGKLAALFGDVKSPRAGEANAALESMLAIVGGDAVSVDRKGIVELSCVKLFCRFTMAMNDLPSFSDHARALAPRTNLLYFPKSYVGKEDRSLKIKLEAEAKSGKLINWALRGLRDLRTRKKFTEPRSSIELFRTLEYSTTPALLFASECCDTYDKADMGVPTIGSPGVILKDEIYAAWRGWCELQGRQSGQREQFGRWLMNALPGITAVRLRDADGVRQYYYVGVDLTQEAREKYLK